MSFDLKSALVVSTSGMRGQASRLRVVAENMANAQSTATEPGGEPFRRKTISFRAQLDHTSGIETLKVDRIGRAPGDFRRIHDPDHPAADESGYVLQANVDPLVEMMDMREAQRSYEANLNTLSTARSMLIRTIELLRG